jgi:hypothetical protein
MDADKPAESLRVVETLDNVTDRESFIAFVRALVAERELAEELERERPEYYRHGVALGWQNSTISSYLSAALAQIEDAGRTPTEMPEVASWRAFAEFLYMGKIYE